MRARESHVAARWSQSRPPKSNRKFFQLSQLRKMRGCEQVAAVCYRLRRHRIEFLLVQTRRGRWIFPKGSAEPGLTNAQAAALEAFEEAGVHGRIEEAAFTRYVRRKSGRRRSPGVEVTTDAHLCEVSGLEPPSESNRNPTWFSHEKAKRRVRDGRMPNYAAELGSVIDRAVIRIQSLDSLKKPVLPGHRA